MEILKCLTQLGIDVEVDASIIKDNICAQWHGDEYKIILSGIDTENSLFHEATHFVQQINNSLVGFKPTTKAIDIMKSSSYSIKEYKKELEAFSVESSNEYKKHILNILNSKEFKEKYRKQRRKEKGSNIMFLLGAVTAIGSATFPPCMSLASALIIGAIAQKVIK